MRSHYCQRPYFTTTQFPPFPFSYCTEELIMNFISLQIVILQGNVLKNVLKLPVQWVPNTTNVVSLNPPHGKVYSVQHYVIKFVSDLRQVIGFFTGTAVSSPKKTDCHDITEILLKVVLNTINPSLPLL